VPARTRALDVWMNGEVVGVWFASRAGVPVFQYDATWLQSPRARPLSLSLPLLPANEEHRGPAVAHWFDNLLPDSTELRDRIRRRFRTASAQPFDLLRAVGRDCVGAVQLVPAGSDPGDVRRIDAAPLDEADVARHLRAVRLGRPLDEDEQESLRISIAGAQEKSALLFRNRRWYLPRGATPTTHILKLPIGYVGTIRADLRQSVENEWLCLRLLRAFGLAAPDASIATFVDDDGPVTALVVTRFDRQLSARTATAPAWIARLPQEDLCQATGTPGARKYESDGGPGIPAILALLQAGDSPREDAVTFAKAQLAYWLLAAIDGHAKNYSIFLHRRGYVLAPLYDVISAWPVIGKGASQWPVQKVALAMALRDRRPHRHLMRIVPRHFRVLAETTGAPDALSEMTAMVERASDALAAVEAELPPDFPETVWRSIARGVRAQRERFLAGRDA